jgi:protein gp37
VDGELKHRPLADALDPWRLKLWGLIKSTPALTWLVLTKRPQNIGRMLPDELKGAPNLWLGTTVGKPGSLWRAERLIMEAPWAEVRFLSMEPLLERTSLHEYHTSGYSCSSLLDHIETGDGDQLPGIDWVIAGSESGDGARPMNTDWARLLRDECKNYGRAFFLKQADFGQEGISSFDGGPHPSYKKRDLRTSSDGMRRAHLIIEQPALDGIQHVNWPKEE